MKKNVLLIKSALFGLVLFLADHSYGQSCPSGMVSYWKMDEVHSTTLTDYYGGHNATSDVALHLDENGRVGVSQFFNGNNTVVVPNSTAYNFGVNSSFTIEVWVKTQSSGVDISTISKNDYHGTGAFWSLGINGAGKPNFLLRDSNDDYEEFEAEVVVNDGNWHHLVAVRDEATEKNILYIDGTNAAEWVHNYSGSFTTSANIAIGFLINYSVPSHFYKGSMDEVAIYNRALSPAEIADHYTKGNIGVGYCDGLSPRISSVPKTLATVGIPYSYTVYAGGTQTGMQYSLITKPTGMTINSTSGLISWTPSTAAVDGTVKVRANNGVAPADTQSFVISIAESSSCPSNLMVLLKLDEDYGLSYNDFYQDHNPTTIAPPTATTGKINGAQLFDEYSKLDIPDHGSEWDFATGSSFSVECWMKTTESRAMVAVTRALVDTANERANWWVGTDGAGHPRFEVTDNNPTPSTTQLTAVSAVHDGAWHHVVAVLDGTNDQMLIYVDGGEADASVSVAFSRSFISDAIQEVNVGYMRRPGGSIGSEYHFIGALDEVAIYNRALTESEVIANYNGGSPAGHCVTGNYGPDITSTPVTTATEDVAYSYSFTVNDLNTADVLTLSAVAKPAWLNFSWTTGQKTAFLSGTPTNDNVGDHNVTLRVSDGQIQKDQSFTITVQNVNDLPVITSTPDLSAEEGTEYTYTLTVTDVDVDDVIDMSVVDKPAWLTFTYVPGAKTATLSGTPGNSDIGPCDVDISITDGHATIHESYTLTVYPVNDPPVIEGQDVLSVDEDESITLLLSDFTVTDVDNPSTDWTLIVHAGTDYTFDGTTVTPAANFNGLLEVNVTVSDLVEESEVFVADITVNAVNDAPEITSNPSLSGYVGDLYIYVLTATDVDNATLTYSASLKPDFLSFSPSTGILTGTPAQADKGQHLILLNVSDGTNDVDQMYTLTIDGPDMLNNFSNEGISVYPVPASDYLNIKFDNLTEEGQLEVINYTGKVVKKEIVPANNYNFKLDLGGIENGVYYLHIRNNSFDTIGKIVVIK